MKKLFTLVFALMLSTCVAMAQDNAALVNQAGEGNSSTIGQNGDRNVADTQHVGNDNVASISQAGTRVHANTVYGSGEAGRGPLGITQTGNANSGAIQQEGTGVRAGITQTGDANTATLSQVGSTPLNAYITQIGEGNAASIDQSGSWGDINVEQVGTQNVAHDTQTSVGGQNAK